MASYRSQQATERDGEKKTAVAAGVGEQHDGIGRLPGVVNDLPEVAPHEWIYLMS